MVMANTSTALALPLRYVEQRAPIVFPESESVPETQLHLLLRTLLYQLLQDEFGNIATVGSDQFVYFHAEDPSEALAPGVYLRLTPPTELVRTWKVWERGAPELAVEIASDSDATDSSWQVKLGRYRRMGVRELVCFDSQREQRPLRIWDRVHGALLEREVTGARANSLVLGVDWLIAPADELPRALRIARGENLVLTRLEARDAERQAKAAEHQAKAAERRAKELERDAKEVERQARDVAEARVRELEAELLRRR
jgi:hypothetical protein